MANNGVRRSFLMLALFIFCSGVVVLWRMWTIFPPTFSQEFFFLLIAGFVSENYAVEMGEYSFSIAYPLVLAALVLCGPTAALILSIATSVSIVDAKKLHWSVSLFNVGQLLVASELAAGTYAALGGKVLLASGSGAFSAADFPTGFVPLLATAVVGSMGNITLASLGVSVKSGEKISVVLRSVGWLPLGQLILGVVGFTIAQAMAINIYAFVFFVFPLFIARQFHQRFMLLHFAFTDTLRSLIGALEAKDPYTRGHSERVAEYAVALGLALGLESKALNDLEQIALLHDLGKLALPGELLRKKSQLNFNEWEAVRRHPETGATMLSKIPSLNRFIDPIRYHHERFDGSGYPSGSKSSELGLNVRILAIADSYDAMTSDRPYRPALSSTVAAEELRRCAGAQFDPALVELFINTLLSQGDKGMNFTEQIASETKRRGS
ncbi:MAG: HD-GYP domain-containing protein [Coriobacteriia bacterium]|nr:HD-GYP domain-containing protein [Coriobacteriia bacterium]